MKSQNVFFLLATWAVLAFSACDQEDPATTPDTNVYESCCGDDPVEFNSGDAYLYVPNVFTPNADGINDYFAPSINEQILGFDSYLIYTPVGDTVIFASSVYDPANVANTAWDGNRQNGAAYTGRFKYEFSVFLQGGGLYQIEGYACRIACGSDASIFKTKTGCYYPSQINTSGYLDATLSNNESNCFE